MAGIAAEEKFLKATGSMTGFGQRYGDFDETLGRMIDLMKKMPDRVLYHFVRTATQEQYVLADDFEKICSAYPNGMENAPMIVALSSCAGVENQGTVKGKVGEIGKRAAVLRQLGLEYVERYDPVILENVYLTAIGKAPKLDRNGKGTKLAILLSNKSDWNQVFETNADDCRSLIANGYNLIICECKTDKEVVERFFNYGRLKENAGNNAHFQQGMKDHARYDFAVFMAHGTPFVLDYGTDSWWKALNHFYSGDYTLGVRDELMLKLAGDWEGMFTKKAKIGVDACLAGLDMVIIGNFIEMISRVTGQETIGSNRSTNLKKYEFDRDGYVTNMLFYKGKTATAFPK
jgi:hypothetical protein